MWTGQEITSSHISTSQSCVCSKPLGLVREAETCHWSIIPMSPPATSDLMAAVREAGCVDALVSLAPDFHPPAITFSLAPNTAATARERDLAGC